MQRKVEGLIIRKVPYQERHLICTLLLRSGRTIPVLFYGGQGGGKKKKSSVLELGFMMKVELGHARKTKDFFHAVEWEPMWMHKKIRLNHKAFYTMCFFLEVLEKVALKDDLHDEHRSVDDHSIGLFRVISNALVHLEHSLERNDFSKQSETLAFLSKLLIEQGVFPVREHCVLCEADLDIDSDVVLAPDHGGFACRTCLGQDSNMSRGDSCELWKLVGHVSNQKYSELQSFEMNGNTSLNALFNYFCYQFHFEEKNFKTVRMVL